MVRVLSSALMILALPATVFSQSPMTSGVEKLYRRDLKGAEREFSVATSDTSVEMKAIAHRWLGRLSWMIHGDRVLAQSYLDRALEETADSAPVFLERARFSGWTR